MIKMLTNIWKIYAPWRAAVRKMLFWIFLSAWPNCTTRQISYLWDLPSRFFFCKYSTKYMKLIIHSEIWTLLHHLEQIIIFSHFNLECWIFSSLFCREVSRQRNFTQKLKDQTAQKVCLHWQRSAVDCRMGRLDSSGGGSMVSPRWVACPCYPQLLMILSLSLSKTLFLFPTHKQQTTMLYATFIFTLFDVHRWYCYPHLIKLFPAAKIIDDIFDVTFTSYNYQRYFYLHFIQLQLFTCNSLLLYYSESISFSLTNHIP